MKNILLTLILFSSLNAIASNEDEFVYYSLFLERDLEGIILLQQYKSGEVGGILGSFGGYKWIKDVYTKPSSDTLTFIQPVDIDVESSDMEYYMPPSGLLENFSYTFEKSGNDYLVYFFSAQAINSLKGYMAQRQPFSLATLSSDEWTAGVYLPVFSWDIWKFWADNNPSTYCQIVASPLVKTIKNLELNTSDIAAKMQKIGYECDDYFNLIKKPAIEKLDEGLDDKLPPTHSVTSGSGFAISRNGHVISNNHVTEDCEKVQVKDATSSYNASILISDSFNDLALIKGDFKPKGTLAISEEKPSLLQEIYVAGFPYGDSYSDTLKITKGIVSALVGIGNNASEIQIDAAIQPGNSGGPIINENGNIVGVTVASLNKEYFFESHGSIPENTNFGIKADILINFINSSNEEIQLKAPSQYKRGNNALSKSLLNSSVKILCLND